MSKDTKTANTATIDQSQQTPEELQELQNNTELNYQTKKYKANILKIKGLLALNTPRTDIAKITGLHAKTVYKLVREIEKRDLTSSNFVNLAQKCVLNNLKDNNLQAAKMVYDRVHPKEPEKSQGSSTGKSVEVKLVLDVSRLKGLSVEGITKGDNFDDRKVIIQEGERI